MPDHGSESALHVVAIDLDSTSGLEECLACARALGTEARLHAATTANLDAVLAQAPASARRVAVIGVNAATTVSAGRCLISRLRTRWPSVPIVALADDVGSEEIRQWLEMGVADYVTPPMTAAAIVPRLLRLAAPTDASDTPEIEGLVGRSPAFRTMIDQLRAVARCDGTVLIQGETGTGKELCARAIHQWSGRRPRPFCAINCGAIPKDLIENELFGHRKAAFTGASATHVGLIAAAEGGTLLFDEVDSFGAGEQATLLRFVQSQEYRPLGATRVLKADVRVLAATNANLSEKARLGEFREDLYYRLDMLRVRVPALRERVEDIPLLARHALAAFADKFHARARGFTDAAFAALLAHPWRGNVRELEHVIGRAVAFAFHEEIIGREHLELGEHDRAADALSLSLRASKRRVVEEFERSQLCAYLAAHDGNIGRAAQAAGKNRRAFFELMRKYGIRAEEFQRPRL